LVLVRGGGSLESLLAFNNEALVREIVNFPVPVLVGVGHEKDISLVGLAADKMVSTPTATAEALNESWQKVVALVQLDTQKIFSTFAHNLAARHANVERSFQTMRRHLQTIFDGFRQVEQGISQTVASIGSRINELRQSVVSLERLIVSNSPERQLKLGYSIVRSGDAVVRKVSQVKKGQSVRVRVQDGSFASDVTEIIKEV